MATRKEDLDSFVRRQSADDLAKVLLELAGALPEVQQRLERMQLADQPDRLAAMFRKTLNGWRRQSRFLDYRATQEWTTEIQAWLAQLGQELLPQDPMAVVALAETFIESDDTFFERADDSSGSLGDVMRAGCLLWLQAAARSESPPDMWPARLRRLFAADRYGAREALLLNADTLLSEAQLRAMVDDLEREADVESTPSAQGKHTTTASYSTLTALTLLSRALRDPDIHVRATLRRSPQPNSMQKQDFVLQYMHADRPADALPWLEDTADWYEPNRLRLLAEVLKRLGQTDRSAPIAQKVFEQSLDVNDFRSWLEHLDPPRHAEASSRARELALDHDEPVTAARLLAELDCWDDAEQVLVAEPARINGQDYVWLVPLAKSLETHQCWRGATAVYRALLDAILAKAYTPAYGHGARYWHRLHAIAAESPSFMPLMPHETYIAAIRQKHARKVAFWAHVNKGASERAGSDSDNSDDGP